MRRWLLRFGYDGRPFYGWARQPGVRTIEGEIQRGLLRIGLVPRAASPRLEVASRTDRGVSARGNALALTSSLEAPALLRALNGLAPEIRFTDARPIDPAFRVRSASHREYRYFVPGDWAGVERWSSWTGLFSGRSVDVRSFGRSIASAQPVWRTVDRAELHGGPHGYELRLRAPSFVWGMVRKIVGALQACAEGRIAPSDLAAATRGERRLSVPLAPAEPLVLWEVEYPGPWTAHADRFTRAQEAYLHRASREAEIRSRVVAQLLGGGPSLAGTPVGSGSTAR
jgi:tRNA pseudouridine38-40 synthase